jgi:glycosidase
MERAHLLDNHDMHRFLWLAENDTRRLKLALTFLLTTPGTPIIYYGAEVGLSQRAGPDSQDVYARDPMPWGAAQQLDVLDYTRWLIGQRKQSPSLRRGSFARVPVVVSAGEVEQVGAYIRAFEDEVTVVIFNNGETPADYSIDRQLVAQYTQAGSTQPAVTLLSPEGVIPQTVDVASGLTGTLHALSAAVVTWRPAHAKRGSSHNIGEEVTVSH